MSKLGAFILAVLDHWAVLVTGGLVTAGLAVLNAWLQKPIAWRFYKWLTVIFIASACFLAWRDEYDRAQTLFEAKADLEGRLRERERRLEDFRAGRGTEEQRRAIEKLETANAELTAELRSAQQTLSALQASLKPRRLNDEEREKIIAVLATQDGRRFGVIEVTVGLGCDECMIYQHDFVRTINSVAGWRAQSVVETKIPADVNGLIIGVNDSTVLPPKGEVIGIVLQAAGQPFTRGTIRYLSPDQAILIIGRRP